MKHSIVRLLAVGLFLGALFSSTISMASAEILSIDDICASHHGCVFIEIDPYHFDCGFCGLDIDMTKFYNINPQEYTKVIGTIR